MTEEQSKIIEQLADTKVRDLSKELIEQVKIQLQQEKSQTNDHEQVWMDSIEKRFTSESTPYNKKVLVVVATQKTEEKYRETDEFKALDRLIYNEISYESNGSITLPLDVKIMSENSKGLSELYNEFIHVDYSDYYVCFIHDDATILDTQFFEKVQKYHETYEVLGVAGATQFQLPFRDGKHTAWHLLARDPQGNFFGSGDVQHQNPDGSFKVTHFGPSPQPARLIDGVFMSFDIEKCLKHKFEFDNRFQFHHYDLAASLNALTCGFTIGVVPIMIFHKGTGDSMNSPEWAISHKKFVNAFRNYGV